MQSLADLARQSPELNDRATLEGISDIVAKLAPLLQGKRLHNVVDLLSAVSDVVDMADDAMVQKLMKGYEDVVAGAWNLNNITRHSAALAGAVETPPTLWQGIRAFNRDEDARRGLLVAMNLLSSVGRQARLASEPIAED
ncbi:DUF1641 domain-containing protein [Lysobacter ciconiae]|uniref:DUF1641 domain-containing protein n=2 Tax=Lysobacterales TaxID=135614 RepID=A0A7S6UIB1_9GAMM|nr:DUF1641 domain-containing protein [Lysobacter ciconiae]QOY64030.1 DUF1641 domain-containing protein [Lysobacter sp. H21R4]